MSIRLGSASSRLAAVNFEASGLSALTAAERRVLELIATDITTKEIAAKLDISPRTVDNHRANMCRKLELSGSHSLLKYAFDHRDQLSGDAPGR